MVDRKALLKLGFELILFISGEHHNGNGYVAHPQQSPRYRVTKKDTAEGFELRIYEIHPYHSQYEDRTHRVQRRKE